MNEQEFVIGGYTPPQGSRKYFGAILVGYYRDKKLFFAGKVGTGFTAKSLSMLHEKFQAEKGWISVPDGPGLGLTTTDQMHEFLRRRDIAAKFAALLRHRATKAHGML